MNCDGATWKWVLWAQELQNVTLASDIAGGSGAQVRLHGVFVLQVWWKSLNSIFCGCNQAASVSGGLTKTAELFVVPDTKEIPKR